MYRVKVVCDNNFIKGSDIDKAIDSLLKMFKKRFVRKSKPLASDSNMERIYQYDGMTHDELRIMKKILDTNKTRIHLKTIHSELAEEKAASATSARKKARRLRKSSDLAAVCAKDKKVRDAKQAPSSSVASSEKLSTRSRSERSAASRASITPHGSEASFGSSPEADSKSAVAQEMRALCTSMQSLIDRLEQL